VLSTLSPTERAHSGWIIVGNGDWHIVSMVDVVRAEKVGDVPLTGELDGSLIGETPDRWIVTSFLLECEFTPLHLDPHCHSAASPPDCESE